MAPILNPPPQGPSILLGLERTRELSTLALSLPWLRLHQESSLEVQGFRVKDSKVSVEVLGLRLQNLRLFCVHDSDNGCTVVTTSEHPSRKA